MPLIGMRVVFTSTLYRLLNALDIRMTQQQLLTSVVEATVLETRFTARFLTKKGSAITVPAVFIHPTTLTLCCWVKMSRWTASFIATTSIVTRMRTTTRLFPAMVCRTLMKARATLIGVEISHMLGTARKARSTEVTRSRLSSEIWQPVPKGPLPLNLLSREVQLDRKFPQVPRALRPDTNRILSMLGAEVTCLFIVVAVVLLVLGLMKMITLPRRFRQPITSLIPILVRPVKAPSAT